MEAKHQDILKQIQEEKVISQEMDRSLKDIINDFMTSYLSTHE